MPVRSSARFRRVVQIVSPRRSRSPSRCDALTWPARRGFPRSIRTLVSRLAIRGSLVPRRTAVFNLLFHRVTEFVAEWVLAHRLEPPLQVEGYRHDALDHVAEGLLFPLCLLQAVVGFHVDADGFRRHLGLRLVPENTSYV